jgi:hypothetical protein
MVLVHKVIETQAKEKSYSQLLVDIAQAALHTRFISEKPKLFIHITHSFIEIHLRKDAFNHDYILRETAMDAGILIEQLRRVIMNLGYHPIMELELVENGTVRVARFSLGTPIENHLQSRISQGYSLPSGYLHSLESKTEHLLAELQGRLIDRQLYVHKIHHNAQQDEGLHFAVVGAFYHLGGWLEVGMIIGRAVTEINSKKNAQLFPISCANCAYEVPAQDRQRGRTLLLTIEDHGTMPAMKEYDLLQFLV